MISPVNNLKKISEFSANQKEHNLGTPTQGKITKRHKIHTNGLITSLTFSLTEERTALETQTYLELNYYLKECSWLRSTTCLKSNSRSCK